jgi:hypothetical protein
MIEQPLLPDVKVKNKILLLETFRREQDNFMVVKLLVTLFQGQKGILKYIFNVTTFSK